MSIYVACSSNIIITQTAQHQIISYQHLNGSDTTVSLYCGSFVAADILRNLRCMQGTAFCMRILMFEPVAQLRPSVTINS